jgi:hypothetical protein
MISSFRKKRLEREQKPNHESLQKAIDDYLRHGGKITKLYPEEMAPNFIIDSLVDDFLMGSQI